MSVFNKTGRKSTISEAESKEENKNTIELSNLLSDAANMVKD